jgi:uncharacterized protein YndB with AHSA1/START domain
VARSDRKICIERRFAAPRDTVFAAWMDAGEIEAWFAAAPFVVTSVDWMPDEGSSWRVEFRSPDGSIYQEAGTFLEVQPPEKLVFSLTQTGLPQPTSETIVTVAFEAVDEAETVMIFRQTGFTSAGLRDGNEAGWQDCFDALGRHLNARY